MKILQVIEFFNPKFGGSMNFCYNLSRELAKLGHEVTIITSDFEFDEMYAKSIKKEGIKVVHFKCTVNLFSFLYSPSMKSWLNSNIREFDIIHMHNFRTYQNHVVNKYANKFDVPYILHAHGSVLPFFQKQNLKKIYDYKWGYNLLKHSARVIAGTNAESEQYIKMGVKKNRIEIIPYAIDISQFEDIPIGRFRKKYGINESDKIILYLGRISKIKGIDFLLNSFRELGAHHDDFKLVLIGPDGGVLSKVRTQIDEIGGDKIVYTGLVPEQIKLEAYADADVYVLPSLYDSFPVTVLEALASGTPVIVTNRCLISDIVEKVGVVVEYNENSLNEALLGILCCDDLRNELGEKSRELVKNNYTYEKVGNKFEKLYCDLKSF